VKIGLSLSLCIREIIQGKVLVEDVVVIISNTAWQDDATWAKGLERYKTEYWQRDPAKAISIVRRLRRYGLIIQPRLRNPHVDHTTSNDIWIELENQGMTHQ
jgi:hypothetical protein